MLGFSVWWHSATVGLVGNLALRCSWARALRAALGWVESDQSSAPAPSL